MQKREKQRNHQDRRRYPGDRGVLWVKDFAFYFCILTCNAVPN
jgi:hypothetical protein